MEPQISTHCNQRLSPDCGSVGECAASSCGLEGCKICPNLSKLDAEISKAQNLLAELSNQRTVLSSQINEHHKPFINRLPFELISHIFIESGDWYPFRWCAGPVHLGMVCRMWRNVTLATPQLWTAIRIRVKSWKTPYPVDMAEKWFNRSRSLPLALHIEFLDCSNICEPHYNASSQCNPCIDLIRSHSARWNHIWIESNSPDLLHQLFNNLQDIPVELDHLDVGWCRAGSQTFHPKRVLFPRSIYQTESRFGAVGLWDLPCGFERLTYIDTTTVPIDEMFYLIRNSPNLESCKASLGDDSGRFPLPTTPIVAHHLIDLDAVLTGRPHRRFFRYLTLPSLRTLDYLHFNVSSQRDIDDLNACLMRSSPRLQDFSLELHLMSPVVHGWYEILPTVTSVTVDLTTELQIPESLTRCPNTEDFLAALARRTGTPVFPKLRRLRLCTWGMSEAAWSSLCDIFGSHQEANAGVVESQDQIGNDVQPSPFRRDLLKEIEISDEGKWERNFATEERVFDFFEDLKKSVGVELRVENRDGPKFGRTASISATNVDTVE